MKDNFSSGSAQYALFRPVYPAALFEYLLTLVPGRKRAWDCGTGNGQVAGVLASAFEQVDATDISASQVANAFLHERISYSVQAAEKTSFPDHCFDLITVAQAIHWFDFDAFYREVHRTLRPGGVLAVIGYNLPRFGDAVDAVVDEFYRDIIAPYWDRERRYIDEGYQTIPFPFPDLAVPAFTIDVEWSFEQLTGYIGTWSAVKHYRREKGQDPVELVVDALRTSWGLAEKSHGQFPILLRVAIPFFLYML
jgi:SAM-dependent methyltransferase